MDKKTMNNLMNAVHKLIDGQNTLEDRVEKLEDNLVDLEDKFTENWNQVGILEAYQLTLNDLIKEMDNKLDNLKKEMKNSIENIEELKVKQEKHDVNKSSYDKPFTCDHCEDEFDLSWKLEQHMTNHQESKKYSCSQCAKTFCMEWRLRKHTSLHDNIYRKKCHFYNNDKKCPYEEIGCMYKHELAGKCDLGLKCKRKLCQFQHTYCGNETSEKECLEELVQPNCSMCDKEFGMVGTVKTLKCDECGKFVCKPCALKTPISEEYWTCEPCIY